MPSSTSHITSLTADYEAIERAIRETSRGRWFLTSYLERNRSAETKMLLEAIGKLESAMRENGQIVQQSGAFETLVALRDAFDRARDEMAELTGGGNDPATAKFPSRRFDFSAAPADVAAQVDRIRDAAASIHSAAYALQAAGVFQGVASQIVESANEIEGACVAQETALAHASRMARLVSDIEAELINAFEDGDGFPYEFYREPGEVERGHFPRGPQDERSIPDEVVEEISAALSFDDSYYGPEKA